MGLVCRSIPTRGETGQVVRPGADGLEENLALLRRFVEAVHRGEIDASTPQACRLLPRLVGG